MESFSSTLFLEACGLDRYAQQFTKNGYETLEQCMKLRSENLSDMGLGYLHIRRLLDLAGRLEGRGEEAVVELLVSIPHTLSYPSSRPVRQV